MSSYSDAVAYLDSHIGSGVRPGLERISALLSAMGEPQLGYPIITVAGSNGKTSVSRIVTSILVGHGLRVGTYTSPHLQRVEERLALDGEVAKPDQFGGAVSDVRAFVDLMAERGGERPTYFELTTATALSYFATNAVDVAVMEVGLGGRLDATNAVDARVAVVTSISHDHQEYLGDDLGAISAEKVAITKPGSILVTGPLPAEAELPVLERVAELGAVHRRFGKEFTVDHSVMAVGGWSVDVEGVYDRYPDIFLPLHGRHQGENLAVAVAATEEFFGRPLSLDVTQEAVSTVTVPGRLEVVGREPLIVIDGAHNPASVGAAAATLKEELPPVEWVVVVGAMRDKDLGLMFEEIRDVAAHVVATGVDHPRARPPDNVAQVAADVLAVDVGIAEDPASAVEMARSIAGTEGAVLVIGSLYLAGEARAALLPGL